MSRVPNIVLVFEKCSKTLNVAASFNLAKTKKVQCYKCIATEGEHLK